MAPSTAYCTFFFFNDTATTEIYTLSLHDALPISERIELMVAVRPTFHLPALLAKQAANIDQISNGRLLREQRGQMKSRSEEHTSELQSPDHLVCRLLLEKKNNTSSIIHKPTSPSQ